MLLEEHPRLVIAFHDHFAPGSGGTSDMCLRGLVRQVPVWLAPGEEVRKGMRLRLGMFPQGRQQRVRRELALGRRVRLRPVSAVVQEVRSSQGVQCRSAKR
ncbi:hypothetical protein, partial [Streptomyces antibioticus]|uniref:hypothetical protein n=1 Tax=Streptomyces antibioticus TaxID=1890 RepID=UPI0033D3949F